jgi:hypothetical protein
MTGDLLEHQQLGAVEMPDDRHAGRNPGRGFVDGREVMQVQDVGLAGARTLELARPGGNLELILVVVERRKDTVRSAGTVLEGRMQWRAAESAREPLRRLTRQSVVERDRADISVEPPRAAVLALVFS